MRKQFGIGIAVMALGLVCGLVNNASAQQEWDITEGSGETIVAEPRTPFSVRFWEYLVRQKYKNWSPWPGKSAGFYDGESPHGAFLKIYANRKAAGSPDALPHGSIVIKENYAEDKATLLAITVMYRSKGFDKDTNDWYWVKYNTDGSVARTPPEKGNRLIAGRWNSCINCHNAADGADYVFANDEDLEAEPDLE